MSGTAAKKKSSGKLATVRVVDGQLQASVFKSHLEAEGIPVLLKYESLSIVYGISFNGLGKVSVLVPEEFADEAKRILETKEEE